ncbi:MORC family CW-type zinc finger protein 4-like [Protopterus annectens]|uniref:MORC family CW-type zinc finger protein 4-like n=1 Tax=Protopterus annectens TaxID=7888 RepID=UPI001CFA1B61|nr:MORC family CW-type zinc finger protein 4-like [Protopterus annectens]
MAALSEFGIRLSAMSPSYLHTNSTSHTGPFSAFAELVDNACDPGVTAKQLWIDVCEIKNMICLTVTDNGNGMTPNRLQKMLSFGFTEKAVVKNHHPIGIYGNGFKSGSMRLGKDALVFTKSGGAMTVGLLSQTYLEAIGANAIVIPTVPFNQQTQEIIVTEDSVPSLEAILKHTFFKTKEEVLEEFNAIPNKKGTRIIIWNLRRNKNDTAELDFTMDKHDIRIPSIGADENGRKGPRKLEKHDPFHTENSIRLCSLRDYLSILYLKPRMQIILRQKKPSNIGNGVGVIGVVECNFLNPAHNKQDFEYSKEFRLTMINLGLKLNEYWKDKKCTKKQVMQDSTGDHEVTR